MSDPVTAPELVEVVRETLARHCGLSAKFGGEVVCTCGESIGSYRRGQSTYARQDHQAHQARAVLAALTEAGTVEWGVEMEGEVVPYVKVRNAHLFVRRVSKNVPTARVVSRLTLPWTAVE